MELFCREIGKGDETLVIIHGLYGSSDNWMTIASRLEDKFRVILPDLRNHGRSPHSEVHDFDSMAADLYETLQGRVSGKIILLGHSMGGKVAMRFAMLHPQMVSKLIVADVAPKSYLSPANTDSSSSGHAKILEALSSTNPGEFTSRKDLDLALKDKIRSTSTRQFLLKNIRRDKQGKYYWQLNITALQNNLLEIMDGFSHFDKSDALSDLPTVFIKGEKSSYILSEDSLVIARLFPGAQIATIPDAGHWIHSDQPELFLKTLLYYID